MGRIKNSVKSFYVFDERIDYQDECKKKGLIKANNIGDDVLWSLNNHNFMELKPGECYSVFAIVLMKLPELSYNELLDMALNSRDYGEKTGSLGFILAKYDNLLCRSLIEQKELPKYYKKLIKSILKLLDHSSAQDEFSELLSICKSIVFA